MKLKIELNIKGLTLGKVVATLDQLTSDLANGKGDAADAIRLGMLGRQRLYGPDGSTIGFADITE